LIKTLDDLYKFTNEKLLDGELSGVDDVIEYFEECQQMIASKYPIEAPKVTLTLTSNVITKPLDFMSLRKIVWIERHQQVNPLDIWGNEITLPEHLTYNNPSVTVDFYYYKKPAMLDADNLEQIPDIDQRYLPLMAKYAAELYKLADDDTEAKDAYRQSFQDSLVMFGNLNMDRKRFNFNNVW
jgi:hypothetical protein